MNTTESNTTRLSIVFPVFNALSFTERCLKHLEEKTSLADAHKLAIDIVLVDDGSTDGTAEWVSTHCPDVKLIPGDGNLWWSGGMNKGIQYALHTLNADYILLWNNDVRPVADYFIKLAAVLATNPTNCIVLSTVYVENKEKQIIFSLGGNFNPFTGKHALIGFGKEAATFCPPPLEINWFPGMGTTIHKSVFEAIGYFDDKNFPQYKGDADFALRAHKAGFLLKRYPELTIWNDRENTGYSNTTSFKKFVQSLVSRKSNNNLYRDILFYHRHTKGIVAYGELTKKYFTYIGGYFKWKFLGLFGLTRKNRY